MQQHTKEVSGVALRDAIVVALRRRGSGASAAGYNSLYC